jgi:hypothetical protein
MEKERVFNIKYNKLTVVKMFTYVVIYALMILVYYLLYKQANDLTNPFEFPSIVLYVSPIVMILFGILLNFEKILQLINAKGKFNVDWLRLVIVVLPLAPISFLNLIHYSQIFQHTILTYYVRQPVVSVAQFLLGYLLVSCFSKRSELESSN